MKNAPVFSTKKNPRSWEVTSSLPPRDCNESNQRKHLQKRRRNAHAPPYEDHPDWAMESPAASNWMQLLRRFWEGGALLGIDSYPLHWGYPVGVMCFFKLSLSKTNDKKDQKGQVIDSIEKVQVSLCQEGRLFFSSTTIYCCQRIFPTHSV